MGKKLTTFPLISGIRQGCSLSPVIQHSTGIPSQRNKTGRRNSNWKGSSQSIPICKQHDLIPKISKNLQDTINSFTKVAGYKINLQKSVAYLYTNNEQTEKEYRKIIPFTIASKKIKYLGINLTKDVKDL
jgi:hypothetical protein